MLSRTGVAWRWPCFYWVWPTRKLCDGLPGSRDARRLGRSRHGNDSGLMRGVDLPELVGNGAWLDGRAARVPDGTLHEPDDDNLANGDLVRAKFSLSKPMSLCLAAFAIARPIELH